MCRLEWTIPATILVGSSSALRSAAHTAKRFASRETGGAAPLLTVTFTEPAAALTVSIAADSFSEGAAVGATTATVARSGSTSNALVVTLSSNDATEANVQASVTIPAGQASSPAFNIDAVDDNIVITVTAVVPSTAVLNACFNARENRQENVRTSVRAAKIVY